MAIDANIADEIPAEAPLAANRPAPAASTTSPREPVASALARLDHVELRALGAELHELLHVAPDFVWWVARLANWETNRRAGLDARWPPDPEVGCCIKCGCRQDRPRDDGARQFLA